MTDAVQLDPEPVGDPVCWLPRVCDECGAISEADPPVACARCGAAFPED